MSDVKEQIKQDYLSGAMPKILAEKYNISLNTVKSWIKRYGWAKLKNGGAPSNASRSAPLKKKHGGQPGNKNAVGHGVPKRNKNAEKFGFFSKYLPEETVSIIQEMPADPLDVLWDQIQIAYAAIIRAQQLMYVKDKDDKTVEKIEEKDGNVIGECWEVQQAWDKQGNFLKVEAREQSELRSMVRQYDELLHKNWDLAARSRRPGLTR